MSGPQGNPTTDPVTMSNAEELRRLAAMETRPSWDYVQSAMRSAADELDRNSSRKNWTIWQCIEHGRMFAAHAGCSYCREGRPPIRSELSADSPDIHFAAVLKEYERGEPINASDLVNALSWRVRNQRKRIADLEHKVQELENPSAHVAAGVTGHD